jgi:hypothetical protein
MRPVLRLLIAATVWACAAALGWLLHQPAALPSSAIKPELAAATASTMTTPPSPQTMAARVAAADPMGLKRSMVAAFAALLPAAAPATSAPANWRLAALVVRHSDRYAILTSGEQTPLSLRAGDLLPDGDRISAVHANHIEIKSPRGRLRTLYLIEP